METAEIIANIDDIVDEMKGNWKELFLSEEYGIYIHEYVDMLISGVYESLKTEGANLSSNLTDTRADGFKLERLYDPNSECKTADCISTDKQFRIRVNGAGRLVNSTESVESKHTAVMGMLVHEVGHRLFTDFLSVRARTIQMVDFGKFYPEKPDNINTPEGILLNKALRENPEFRKTFSTALQSIWNATEDGYVEQEMAEHYPGSVSLYLGEMNRLLIEQTPTLTDMSNEKDPSRFNMVFSQWLMYAKFAKLKLGEKKKEDFDSDVILMIENGMDTIDEIVNTRDPKRRELLNAYLGVMIYPFLDEDLKNHDKQESKKNQAGQNNSQNSQNGGSAAANKKMQQQIQSLANQFGGNDRNYPDLKGGKTGSSASNENSGAVAQNTSRNGNGQPSTSNVAGSGANNTRSIADPNRNPSVRPNVKSSDRRGGMGGNSQNKKENSFEDKSLDEILHSIAMNKLTEEEERKRTEKMQTEANEIKWTSKEPITIKIHREARVDSSLHKKYEKENALADKIAGSLARILLKRLKAYEDDDTLEWQYSGTKFSSKQFCRDPIKGFQKKTLPREVPNLYVYMLCDESGSVSGDVLDAITLTSACIESFCRKVNIPLCLQGYSNHEEDHDTITDIYSYVEEKKIDKKDKYRIMDMSARGGTPTATAVEYAINRMCKHVGTEKKLLLVATDGEAGDDRSGEKTKQLIEIARKKKITVVGCGIGSCKRSVEQEFGPEHYLPIDNLDEMPKRLLDVIRRNMDGVR